MTETEETIATDLQKKIRFLEKLISDVLTIPENSDMPKEALEAAEYFKKGTELILEHIKREYTALVSGEY